MQLQYFSDLHLEFYHDNIPKVRRLFDLRKPFANIALCAGDLGKPSHQSYKAFLQDMSLNYEQVYFVTGNHEYYGMQMSMNEVDNMCREIARNMPQQNVNFLQNEYMQLSDGVSIFGATFWSHIPKQHYSTVTSFMNDYVKIKDFTPDVSNILHQQSINALFQAMECHRPPQERWVVLSHHMPSMNLIDPQYYKYEGLNHAFASEITVAEDPRICAWVYGHTHTPQQSGKFYCNPIGYPGENKQYTLNKSIVI